MKTFTLADIRSWNPCYDPNRYLPETWTGTALDILNNENIPVMDRLWVVLRKDLLSERLLRLFSVWCYRETLKFVPNQDLRSIEAANVAERFANNEATVEELAGAESAAWSAAWSAARSGVESAAWSAARAAAWSAAWSAAEAAESAARSAVSALREDQKDKLVEMIQKEDRS